MLIVPLLLACGSAAPICSNAALASEPLAADCVTRTLSCGDKIEGNTAGGADNWSDAFYREKFCTPLPESYTGPERVYRLELPDQTRARVRLDSPCEDLDLFAVRWPDDSCPTRDHAVNQCEADVHKGDGEVTLVTIKNPATWLIAVDGKQGVTGGFSLEVRCEKR